jgi:hypothetical protein
MAEVILSKSGILELIGKLKKANKQRREKLAIKAGFPSYSEYIGYLNSAYAAKESAVNEKPNIEETIVEPKTVDVDVMEFKTPLTQKEETDMVISFDSTGSMRQYVDAVKKYTKELIPKMLAQNPNLKISIVVFGDYCDMENIANHVFGKAYQFLDLTNDENALIKFVNGARDTVGGDSDEFYELVLRKIRTETSWRSGSNKSVLLIADFTPHEAYAYRTDKYCKAFTSEFIDWREECKLLAADGIKVDTLRILDGKQFVQFYEAISEITGGLSLPFKDSKQTSDLLEMSSLARGGQATNSAFRAMATDKRITENPELQATYTKYFKSMSK